MPATRQPATRHCRRHHHHLQAVLLPRSTSFSFSVVGSLALVLPLLPILLHNNYGTQTCRALGSVTFDQRPHCEGK